MSFSCMLAVSASPPVISSSIPNPIRPIGSAVTLTCTVELNPAVDVPVIVDIEWTGPAGFRTTNTTQPVMGSSTVNYTSTAMINSFGRNQSGVYSCTATISSISLFLTKSMGQAFIRLSTYVGKAVVKIFI